MALEIACAGAPAVNLPHLRQNQLYNQWKSVLSISSPSFNFIKDIGNQHFPDKFLSFADGFQ